MPTCGRYHPCSWMTTALLIAFDGTQQCTRKVEQACAENVAAQP